MKIPMAMIAVTVAMGAVSARAEGLRALDINGVSPGMTITQAEQVLGIKAVQIKAPRGEDWYSGKKGAEQYLFQLTNLGRIYQLGYIQKLGDFSLSPDFVRGVFRQLVAKYGPYSSASSVSADWEVNAPDRSSRLKHLAVTFEGTSTTSLHLELEDHTIKRGDAEKPQMAPRTKALGDVRF